MDSSIADAYAMIAGMKQNILILGNGYIANRMHDINGWPICADKIKSYADLENIVKKYSPDVIISAIGFTGTPNTDACEQHIEETISANVFVPVYLAELSFRKPDIHIIHLASGCIFKGSGPYTEDDHGDYEGLFYSRTKIYAEELLNYAVRLGKKITLARIRIPVDNIPSPKNIITKVAGYKTIIDIPNSVTYIPTLARMLSFLIEKKVYGIVNTVNTGTLRYPPLMDEYKKYDTNFQYSVVSLKDIGVARTNLELVPKRLADLGFENENINDLIPEIMREYFAKR